MAFLPFAKDTTQRMPTFKQVPGGARIGADTDRLESDLREELDSLEGILRGEERVADEADRGTPLFLLGLELGVKVVVEGVFGRPE